MCETFCLLLVELYVKYLDVMFGECELYPVAAAGAELTATGDDGL